MREIVNFFFSHVINSVDSLGLVLDVAGVILLYFYGLPSRIHTPSKLLTEEGLTDKELDENKKIEFWSGVGLVMIAIGFILQTASQWLG